MKKNLLLLTFVASIISSCADKIPQYDSFAGLIQGTTYTITFEKSGKIKKEKLQAGIHKIFTGFDNSLSTYNKSSIISRINRDEKVTPDSLFIEVFNKAKEISELTGGAFDITVGPLVNAWGFGPDAIRNFNPSKLDSLMNLVGYNKVSVIDGKVVKSDPGIALDVNAIAQGFTVDKVAEYMGKLGIKSFLVEIGGEVRVKGTKGGALWRIGIDEPDDSNIGAEEMIRDIIGLKDKSVSTSGNYRKFYIDNGVKYSHTIDPKTGRPVRHNLLSTTILADDCITADAFATACMVLGKDGAVDLITKYGFIEGYLIYSDEKGKYVTWMSENFSKLIQDY
jgi:thiamine biosynthesis lipoprotein